MTSESNPNRRTFLTAAFSTVGSTLPAGLSPSASIAQEPAKHQEAAINPSLSLDSLYHTSTLATTLTGEAADRLAIRRLAHEQSNLFVADGTVVVFEGDPATHKPVATLSGKAEILTALAVLNKFTATTHFNGQSDVVFDGDHAIGETYCMAHQLSTDNGQRKLQILSIRYYDKFVRRVHRWYFAERKLITDWSDTRFSAQ